MKKGAIPTEKVFIYMVFALQLPVMVLLTSWAYGTFQSSTAHVPEDLPIFLSTHHQAMNCFSSYDYYTKQFQPFVYDDGFFNETFFEQCSVPVAGTPVTRMIFNAGNETITVTSPTFVEQRYAERRSYFPSIQKYILESGETRPATLYFEVQS